MIEEELQRVSRNANVAIRMFAEIEGHTLGFDEDSIRIVDEFVNTKVGVFADQILSNMVSVLGAFLGECVRKNWGGTWDIINSELGIRFDEKNAVFPFSKVRKQLENGAADSILSFYQIIPIVFQLKK